MSSLCYQYLTHKGNELPIKWLESTQEISLTQNKFTEAFLLAFSTYILTRINLDMHNWWNKVAFTTTQASLRTSKDILLSNRRAFLDKGK